MSSPAAWKPWGQDQPRRNRLILREPGRERFHAVGSIAEHLAQERIRVGPGIILEAIGLQERCRHVRRRGTVNLRGGGMLARLLDAVIRNRGVNDIVRNAMRHVALRAVLGRGDRDLHDGLDTTGLRFVTTQAGGEGACLDPVR